MEPKPEAIDVDRLSLRDRVRMNKLLRHGHTINTNTFKCLDDLKPLKEVTKHELTKFNFPKRKQFIETKKPKAVQALLIENTSPFLNKYLLIDP